MGRRLTPKGEGEMDIKFKAEQSVINLLVEKDYHKEWEKKYFDVLQSIKGQLYRIGGPLNDNFRNFNKEQLKEFFAIKNKIDGVI